jgi:hypothetical protein
LNRSGTYLSTAVDWSALGRLGERVVELWEEFAATDPLQRLDADVLAAACEGAGFGELRASVEDPGEAWLVTEESVDARLDARGAPAHPTVRERWQAAFAPDEVDASSGTPGLAGDDRLQRPQLYLSARRARGIRHDSAQTCFLPTVLQGPLLPGGTRVMSRDVLERMEWLPQRALVLGLARSGHAAAPARAARLSSRPTGHRRRAGGSRGRRSSSRSEEEPPLEGASWSSEPRRVGASPPRGCACARPDLGEVELGSGYPVTR